MACSDLDELPAFEDEPASADVARLADLLYEYNAEKTGFTDGRRYGLYLRNGTGEIIGGADGWTWGGTCFVTTLIVPPSLRGIGVGTRLMMRIEAEAQRRGCNKIILRSDDYQAPDFYRKLGFKQVADVASVGQHHEFTFIKWLAASDA